MGRWVVRGERSAKNWSKILRVRKIWPESHVLGKGKNDRKDVCAS